MSFGVPKTGDWTKFFDDVYSRRYQTAPVSDVKDTCLHKQCSRCKGSGKTEDGGICIHGISCPCKNCRAYA